VLVLVDPGGFGTQKGSDRMRAACVCTASTPDGEHLILDVHSDPDTFVGVARLLVDWAKRLRPRKIYIEKAGQQLAFTELVRREFQLKKVDVTVDGDTLKPGNKDKDQRILGLEPYFQQGKVYISRSSDFHEFLTQYQQFPRSQRKDVLDALAYGPQVWRQRGASNLSPEQRKAADLRLYRERRGLSFGR
jgi:phage terminase large subunit-like protein